MQKDEIVIFWFRRDLRLEDNIALFHALKSNYPVLPIFIFDEEILENLPKNDARVSFIFENLNAINNQLKAVESSILISKGTVLEVWKDLTQQYTIKKVFFNKDYEPYTIKRDIAVANFLKDKDIDLFTYKDQVIFEEAEIIKSDKTPYTKFTPYKNKWLEKLQTMDYSTTHDISQLYHNFYKSANRFPLLGEIGFIESNQKVMPYDLLVIDQYDKYRDYPAIDKTSKLSVHLRFGTVSTRSLVKIAIDKNQTFLSELIWREFFKQILFHFPKVVTHNFNAKYDDIIWRDDEDDFKNWCDGKTGYPLVDAGMRELNQTGFMHNRVRMVTASFLCKHLLINWKLGEAYFAEKLLDYDLSANNGNWQWAASTGCDAVPYFRIFNPEIQLKKFDKERQYVRKWIKDYQENYIAPIIDHQTARERALLTYKKGLIK
jgi:deoxyribodipyrimidine photo-lyase